ncbi:hypothetical protein K435DRAFT_793052 [Dendrothele bispora CBS 962.96]|uniref:GH16 domain-containing protein n=1 Tax=Dendrothele bispora (strain CBS 962.96) TaxID=1314807 RepID=A0A4S8MGP2_DENBC|nr:hypothetical protein K435DRAFT_793052 [Dendrothele bispora CBS 962.96]
MILQQAQLHRPRGLREVDNFEGYRYKLSKALRSSLCYQHRLPKLTKEGSMALVNRIISTQANTFSALPLDSETRTPSYHHDINTTTIVTTAFERLFLLTIRTNYTKLMAMHFHDLPVFIPALLYIDPTHGTVNKSFALENGLAYFQDETVLMKGDDTTSISQYNTGLFILDINCAPWGCAIWPARWTVDEGQWPSNNDSIVGQFINTPAKSVSSKESTTTNIAKLSWDTGPGCFLTAKSNFTSAVVFAHLSPHPSYLFDNISKTTVKTTPTATEQSPPNAGCGVQEWSRVSYGKDFNLQGGGVFAMKWDENGIAVWSFSVLPFQQTLSAALRIPLQWGSPKASWIIDYMKVYKKQPVFVIVRDSSNALALAPCISMFATAGRMMVVVMVSVIFRVLLL